MSLPISNKRYKDTEYWDERYTTEDEYEWLKSYSSFRHLVCKHVTQEDNILMVGCGNSTLGVDMYKDGYKNIINTDISTVCIENQIKKYHKNFPELKWLVADMTNMTCFKDDTFDVVIEKATIDALLVAEKSRWTVSDETDVLIRDTLHEISRVLKVGGRFISITFDQPHFRIPLLAKSAFNWSVNFETFREEESFHFYFFYMIKGAPLNEDFIKRNTIQDNVQTIVFSHDDVESSDNDEDTFFTKFNVE